MQLHAVVIIIINELVILSMSHHDLNLICSIISIKGMNNEHSTSLLLSVQ